MHGGPSHLSKSNSGNRINYLRPIHDCFHFCFFTTVRISQTSSLVLPYRLGVQGGKESQFSNKNYSFIKTIYRFTALSYRFNTIITQNEQIEDLVIKLLSRMTAVCIYKVRDWDQENTTLQDSSTVSQFELSFHTLGTNSQAMQYIFTQCSFISTWLLKWHVKNYQHSMMKTTGLELQPKLPWH